MVPYWPHSGLAAAGRGSLLEEVSTAKACKAGNLNLPLTSAAMTHTLWRFRQLQPVLQWGHE